MTILTTITFSLAHSWVYASATKWKSTDVFIEWKRLGFYGLTIPLFGKFIAWWLLCMVTVNLYSIWIYKYIVRWNTQTTDLSEVNHSSN